MIKLLKQPSLNDFTVILSSIVGVEFKDIEDTYTRVGTSHPKSNRFALLSDINNPDTEGLYFYIVFRVIHAGSNTFHLGWKDKVAILTDGDEFCLAAEWSERCLRVYEDDEYRIPYEVVQKAIKETLENSK